MMTMEKMTRHFGVTSDDLTNWVKRGFVDLKGTRGVERTFAAAQRPELLRAVFLRAIATACGLRLEDANDEASRWVRAEAAGELSRFYAYAHFSRRGISLSTPKTMDFETLAVELSDDGDVRAGYAGDGTSRGESFDSTSIAMIDRGTIVARLDALLAETAEA